MTPAELAPGQGNREAHPEASQKHAGVTLSSALTRPGAPVSTSTHPALEASRSTPTSAFASTSTPEQQSAMPFRTPRRGTSSSYRSEMCPTTGTSSPGGPTRKVQVGDDELVRRARSSSAGVALKCALQQPTASWDCKTKATTIRLGSTDPDAEGFTLLSRAVGDAKAGHEVLTSGNIACSPQELAAVLRSPDENEFNAVMKGLYRDQFIYGSVVHVVTGTSASNVAEDEFTLPKNHQLAVKTGCFVRSRFLARNEQWCFLEHFQPATTESDSRSSISSAGKTAAGFSVVLSSLPEHELVAGKASGDRVEQLDGVTALYIVEPVYNNGHATDRSSGSSGDDSPQSASSSDTRVRNVRVTFHALYLGDAANVSNLASAKMARNRLMSLAGGVHRLPALVRRRRLGTQVFATATATAAAAHAEAQNSRCISCTKSLRFLALARCARRCQLCSYNVCAACWSRENVETYSGHVAQLGVCKRCLECVDRCDYSDIQRRRPACIVDDPEDKPTAGGRSSFSGQTRRGSMTRSLREELAVDDTKNAALTVIKYLIGQRSSNIESDSDSDSSEEEEEEEEEQYMTAVEEYFQRRALEPPSIEDCVLANAEQRSYPLELQDEASPVAPVPENERLRLESIAALRLMDLAVPMPELDIICAFLSKELGFMCTMITIVGETHQLVLSCTIPQFVQVRLPREHTFCQHLLMGDAPFMVANPQADMRFYNLNPVTMQGIKFYCGIPIKSADGAMVGSICCVHTAPMDITRSQYATLTRFGEIASKIIAVKAKAELKRQQ